MSGKVIVVVGGQYGSEAKGHICAFLGAQEEDLLAIRVGGPNAGHTVYDTAGVAWPYRHLPVAAALPAKTTTRLAIAAGSEVDYGVLHDEIQDTERAGHTVQLTVDPEATLLESYHKEMETDRITGTGQHGSTQKGIGAARSERLLRRARRTVDCRAITTLGQDVRFGNVAKLAHDQLAHGGTVLIEGTQGYGLGTSAGDYPFCTSGNARAIDFLAQAGISPWDPAIGTLEVWVTFRTFPIRIAGNSGPMRNETSFAKIAGGVPDEFTTVTKKLRRVAEWDPKLAWDAIAANGDNVHIALTFLDYVAPEWAGYKGDGVLPHDMQSHAGFHRTIQTLENSLFAGRKIELVTTSATSIVDRRRK